MGMFDTLYINTEKLPVSEEEKRLIGTNPGWQTKDFDCMLSEVYITDEGELKINKHSWGWDESQINGFGTNGVLTRENEQIVTEPYDGIVNFYSFIGKDSLWYEFNANFVNGKLENIEGGKGSTDFFGNFIPDNPR
jgi:hypothetical protein